MRVPPRTHQAGFTLVELLIVVIVISVLAAIGIPRLINQRESAFDAAALSDLRNLVVTLTSIEASADELPDDPDVFKAAVHADGWQVSDSRITACAVLLEDDVSLEVWHSSGSRVYSWQRSIPRINVEELLPDDCGAATDLSTP